MIRLWASWTCYAMGHAASRCIINRWFGWPYLIENRFMNWSVDLQGESERGPWWPKSLVPNEETIAAMKAARRGELENWNGTDMIKRDE